MKCYNIDLSENLKITQMGKETFVPPRTHISRKIKEYIIYLITDGSLSLIHNGENLTLKKNDIFVFDVGDTQAPLNAEFCEYYYIHFVSQKTKVFYSADKYDNCKTASFLQYSSGENCAKTFNSFSEKSLFPSSLVISLVPFFIKPGTKIKSISSS